MPSDRGGFRMAALVGSLAVAGGAGYLAGRPASSDKAAATALLERVDDPRFRSTVEQVARARGIEAPAPAAAASAVSLEATCPVHGVPGIRVPGQPIYVSPIDSRILWAIVDDRPGRPPVDPLENAVLYVPGPDVPYVRIHYREWWLAGNGVGDLEADALRPIPGIADP